MNDLRLDEHTAIIGASGSGKSTTARVRATFLEDQ